MKHLLVVEDDLDIRETVELLLSARGFRVTGAPNGLAAIETCHREGLRPDVVVLDLMMPIMDGWEFLERQADDPWLAGVPVVIVTAQPVTLPLPPHVAGVMAKPVTLDALLDAIDRAARLHATAA